ncbi:hypothetical protein OIU74_002323 [Salix koriyanagi]|uniref:Peptidase A1 domain-containing protein n=1 Tax=Salix koriyanagi TaxID=2511006 RepID=A0A9Q0X5W1_9ROSI|nr:hypothetical protein OIU74_002323 [Salix koriyanagi]
MVATQYLSTLVLLRRQPHLSWTLVRVLFGFLVPLAIFAQNVTSQTLKEQESQHFYQNYHPLQSLLVAKIPDALCFLAPKFSLNATNVTPLPKTALKLAHLTQIQYGSGSTAGLLLSETLDFPNQKTIPDFLVGCSILSTRQPEGIAGFGRSPESLPSQLGLKKFSYCLVSHAFDDTPTSSDLVMHTGSGSDGNGGTIVDSGTTFTFMEKPVYEMVAKEFEKQMAHYTVATEIQNLTGLRPCFNISGVKSVSVPDLIFQFKGGAKMELPLSNYFSFVDSRVICLTIVSDSVFGPGIGAGPAIILGNYQQRNFYVEFDFGEREIWV